MTDFRALLQTLADAGVEFIVVGGVASVAHGASRLTQDVDVVYARNDENLERLVNALAPLHPYLRGAPPGLPFAFDVPTLKAGLNFILETDMGDLDLLGEIIGGGSYADLLAHSVEMEIFDRRIQCLGLKKLIDVKRAAGRPKDLEALAELDALDEESGPGGSKI